MFASWKKHIIVMKTDNQDIFIRSDFGACGKHLGDSLP